MDLNEAKEILNWNSYLLTEALPKYKYKLTITFQTARAADDLYWKYNEDYKCVKSSLGNVLFYWFNEKDEVKKFTNELIDNENIEKIEIQNSKEGI